MKSSGAAARTPSVWQELFDLSLRKGEREPYLDRLLSLWCGEHGMSAAAVYREGDGELHFEASFAREDGESWPLRIRGESVEGAYGVDLSAGRLVYRRPAGELDPADAFDPAVPTGPLTQLIAAELANRSLRGIIKEQRFQASFRGVEMEALYDVGLAIASTLDPEQLSEEILLRAVSLLDARRGALYLRKGQSRFDLDTTFGGDARASFVPAGSGDGGTEVPGDLLPGAEHILVLPIAVEGHHRGLLVVADKESRVGVGPFGEGDRRTLSLFANQAAIALENARLHRQELEKQKLEREMELAAEIQRQFLPKAFPEIPGFELTGWNRPAQQVGGDYFDLVALEDGRLRLVLGDVSGKGMAAALLVATLHSALRLLIGQAALGADLMERLNQHIGESSASNKFITLLVGDLDPATGRLAFFNAGHNPALLLRRGGGVEELEAGGLPVGLLPRGTYEPGAVELAAGDLLCVFSDGITEAAGDDEEEFGAERLAACLEENRHRPMDEIVQEIDRAATVFAAGRPQGDDQTIVLLRRR